MLTYLIIFILLHITYISAESVKSTQNEANTLNDLDINITKHNETLTNQPLLKNNSIVSNNTKNVSSPVITALNTTTINWSHMSQKKQNDFEMQSGALLRGFYVLLGITIILLMYLGFRMIRLRTGSKPSTMVRKYGVLTNRGDLEMLSLQLSEDEDDDTVFELNR